MRPFWPLLRVTTIWLQMQPAERQPLQIPVEAHGVCLLRRIQFGGVAVLRTRFTPSSTEGTILFIPAKMTTSFGPNISAATRLPKPSILISSPSVVIALLLMK